MKFLTSTGALLMVLAAGLLSWWSYAYVDPNLVFINQPVFTAFQSWMWSWQAQPWSSVWLYLILIAVIFIGYAGTLRVLPQARYRWWFLGALALILLVGHNALSHDIFNYLFNAKMVLQYGADPHVQTALDFATDPWVRFMHNVHTPAPYGWGWTAWSLIPYALGLGKFLLAYGMTKLWMGLGLGLSLLALWRLIRQQGWSAARWWAVALHPLMLVETLLNGHNDVWMMWPALWAFVLAQSWQKHPWRSVRFWLSVLLVSALMAASISIKFVTIVLLPLLLLFVPRLPVQLELLRTRLQPWWADLATLVLLLPLVSARSQQFHPWYLVWALSFWALARTSWIRLAVLGLSIASLFRYIPWLESGLQYTPLVLLSQKAITATGLAAGLALAWWKKFSPKSRE